MPVKKIGILSYVPEDGIYRNAQMNLDRDEVVFEYDWNGVRHVYHGRQAANFPGRYDLKREGSNGTLKLFRLQGSERILGLWAEGAQNQGLFLIDVEEEET